MGERQGDMTSGQFAVFLVSHIATVDGISAHFVFNMDEMGHQDWADRQEQTCSIRLTVEGHQVFLPVSRAEKRITLCACIAGDGFSRKPAVIIPLEAVDSDIVTTGLTSEKLGIHKQPKGFMVTEFFDS
jgi:hypothetical protein